VISVKDLQCFKEERFTAINDDNIIGIICLAAFAAVLCLLLLLLAWKLYKIQNSSKSKGINFCLKLFCNLYVGL